MDRNYYLALGKAAANSRIVSVRAGQPAPTPTLPASNRQHPWRYGQTRKQS